MVKAETIKTTDVRGKELYYIKCSNGEHNYFINVGKRTHDEVKQLENVQNISDVHNKDGEDSTSTITKPVQNNKGNNNKN